MPVNKQDRNKQPLRAGGNSAALPSEMHNASKSMQVEIYKDSKGDRAAGKAYDEGGNDTVAKPSYEKHDQKKMDGNKYVGGKLVGPAPVVESDVQVSERRHGAGNNADGGHEHQMCHGGSEKVSDKVNRS